MIFFYKVDEVTLQQNFFALQTKRHRKYVAIYGKYLYFLVTTFNTSEYNLMLCPPKVVFVFRKLVVGFAMAPFEKGADIDLVLEKIVLNYEVTVVGTDREQG